VALAALLTVAATCQAQTQIFPQLTDGGDWRMAIILENTTASATTASLTFYQDTANGATVAWNPPFIEVSNTQNMAIPAGGTLYMHTPGTAATLSQGWGQLTGTGVTGFAIYTYESYSGRPDQDGTSLATTASSRILVPFDCTTGFATGFAIVNPTAAAEVISVNIETDSGQVTQTSLPSLPANGQIAVVTSTEFPATVGHRGMAEFYVSSGSISVAAFRFNPTLALTSLPVLPQTGPPIIGGSSGGGTSPYTSFIISPPLFQPSGSASGNLVLTLTPNAGNQTWSAAFGEVTFTNGVFTGGGLTFTANALQSNTISPPYGLFTAPGGNFYLVSSASLTFTLAPTFTGGGAQEGSFAGTLTVIGTPYPGGGAPVTLSGAISSSEYIAQLAQ
jgi:hypothetical protein